MARVVAVQLGYDGLPGTTITRYCSSSLQTTRMAMHAIKAGEGDVFISAGVETVSRFAKGSSDSWPDTHNPLFADAEARTQVAAEAGAAPGPTRATEDLPRRLHRDGPDRGEPGAAQGRHPRGAWTGSASARRTAPRRPSPTGSSPAEITPVTLPDGTVVIERRRPARRHHRTRRSRGLKPVFRPDGSVTAGNACPLNDGAAAAGRHVATRRPASSASRRWPASCPPASPACRPEIMGLGPVEASKQALARAGHDDRRHRPGRDQRGVRGAGAAVAPATSASTADKLNVHGGAIALGHPFGMTGARITATLLNGLRAPRRAVRAGDDVRRRRSGHGDGRSSA